MMGFDFLLVQPQAFMEKKKPQGNSQKKTREKHMGISPGNGMSRFYVQQLHKSPKQ